MAAHFHAPDTMNHQHSVRANLAATCLRMARDTLRGILRLAYPPTCIGCGIVCECEEDLLCQRCLHSVQRADPDLLSAELARHRAASGTITRALSLWRLEQGSAVQKVHRELKYGNRPTYGLRLGVEMGNLLRGIHASFPSDVIVPIPLHRVRLYERGYNQSAMLAQGIARVLDVPMREDVLLRTRPTQTQTKLSRSERWDNVEGAFTVKPPGCVAGKHILLVDDVFTTGATLLAAAMALRSAGAAEITAVTLCHAQN